MTDRAGRVFAVRKRQCVSADCSPAKCPLLQALLGLGLTCHLHWHRAIRERAVAERPRKIAAPAVRGSTDSDAAGVPLAGAKRGEREPATHGNRNMALVTRDGRAP